MGRAKVLRHFHDDLGFVGAMDNKVAARNDRTAFDDFSHVCLRLRVKARFGRRYIECGFPMIGTCRSPALGRGHRKPRDLVNDLLAGAVPAVPRLAHLQPEAGGAGGVPGVSAEDIPVRDCPE